MTGPRCGECGAGGARQVYPIGVMDGDTYYACETCEAEMRAEHLLRPHPLLDQPHPHETVIVTVLVALFVATVAGVPTMLAALALDLIDLLTR